MIVLALRLAAKVVAAIVALALVYFAVTFVQIWLRGHEHTTRSAQAIVVFGTAEYDGRPSSALAHRLDRALELYGHHRAPLVAVTGGNRPGDQFTEAGVSATFLEDHGVPKSAIIVGGGSDTWQNVASVVAALRADHVRTVITVTDPFHEYRAMAIASAQGLTPYPSPVRHSPSVEPSLWLYYLRETVAVGVGRIVGYGRLSAWTTGSSLARPVGPRAPLALGLPGPSGVV